VHKKVLPFFLPYDAHIVVVVPTLCFKKLHPFYFCNNFVDPGRIWIFFGRYVANKFSSGLQGLGYHAGLSESDTDT